MFRFTRSRLHLSSFPAQTVRRDVGSGKDVSVPSLEWSRLDVSVQQSEFSKSEEGSVAVVLDFVVTMPWGMQSILSFFGVFLHDLIGSDESVVSSLSIKRWLFLSLLTISVGFISDGVTLVLQTGSRGVSCAFVDVLFASLTESNPFEISRRKGVKPSMVFERLSDNDVVVAFTFFDSDTAMDDDVAVSLGRLLLLLFVLLWFT